MYFKLFLDRFTRNSGNSSGGGFLRSGAITGLVIVLLIAGAGIAYVERGRGNVQKIKKHLRTPADANSSTPRPGGLDPVVLSRAQTPNATEPEFLSATMLPGRGMNVLQIKAFFPGLGEINLLDAPTLAAATHAMTGVDDDSAGQASLINGAAFLVPWAGRLYGITSVDGKSSTITWKGQVLNLPSNTVETVTPAAFGGLIIRDQANNVQTEPTPEGGTARAVFNSVDVDASWPSTPETTVSVQLTGKALEMTVDVKNVGDSPMPVGIGWAPRFLIPSGDRSRTTLHLPGAMHSEIRDANSGIPSGILKPVAGTPYDFTARSGAALGDKALGDTFVHLEPSTGLGAAIELRDPISRFGLRIIPLSASIKAISLFSPAGAGFVSVSPQTNYDDPMGRQWPPEENTGMVELPPGQSIQWKIRLELFLAAGSTK